MTNHGWFGLFFCFWRYSGQFGITSPIKLEAQCTILVHNEVFLLSFPSEVEKIWKLGNQE